LNVVEQLKFLMQNAAVLFAIVVLFSASNASSNGINQ